jgi:polar amino acid transport system substrate-binding protein
MMRFKRGLVPLFCLTVAVALLFGRGFIPHGGGLPVFSAMEKPADGEMITLHYHERPPYYMTGPLGVYGLCVDPVKLAFNRAKIPFRWEKTPAKRQLDIVKSNRSKDCLIGWFKNPEREKFAKYSHFVYQDKPTIALARADNDKIISNRPLDETLVNSDLVLLRKNGYSYGPFIDTKITLIPRQEMTNAENIGMLKMIHSRGADYFFISEEEATALIATSGLLKTDFKFIRFTDIPKGNKRYLLFSKHVADEVIGKINSALKKLATTNPESTENYE